MSASPSLPTHSTTKYLETWTIEIDEDALLEQRNSKNPVSAPALVYFQVIGEHHNLYIPLPTLSDIDRDATQLLKKTPESDPSYKLGAQRYLLGRKLVESIMLGRVMARTHGNPDAKVDVFHQLFKEFSDVSLHLNIICKSENFCWGAVCEANEYLHEIKNYASPQNHQKNDYREYPIQHSFSPFFSPQINKDREAPFFIRLEIDGFNSNGIVDGLLCVQETPQ